MTVKNIKQKIEKESILIDSFINPSVQLIDFQIHQLWQALFETSPEMPVNKIKKNLFTWSSCSSCGERTQQIVFYIVFCEDQLELSRGKEQSGGWRITQRGSQ